MDAPGNQKTIKNHYHLGNLTAMPIDGNALSNKILVAEIYLSALPISIRPPANPWIIS